MAEVGQAYLQIIPSMKGVAPAISRQLSGVGDDVGKSMGSSIASRLGGAFSTVAAVGVKAIGAVAGAVGGLAVGGGISRALKIDQATYKFEQMGLDVEAAMASCNEAVTGTAYGLDAAATVAASLGASGVQSGEQMTASLKAVAGMAAMSGRSMEDVGVIFGKVAAQGRLQGDELTQFAENGVNATAALAEHLGKTQAEVREMVKAGEVDFQTFSDAMYAAFGDAAQGANATFQGAASNVMAALSRLGAKFADPALDGLREVFVALIPAIDAVSAAIGPAVESFSKFVSAVSVRAVSGIEAFTAAVESGYGPVGALSAAVTEAFEGTALGALVSKVNGFVGAVRAGVSPVELLKRNMAELGEVASSALQGLAQRFPGIASALQSIDFSKLGGMAAAVGSIGVAFGVIAPKIAPVAKGVADFVTKMGGLSGIASSIGGAITGIATKFNTFQSAVTLCGGGMKGLVAVLGSFVSPVTLVIGAIAALAAGFAYMMATNEGFRTQVSSIVQMLATSLAPILSNLATYVANFAQAVMPLIMQAIQAVLPVLGQVALVILQVAAALAPVVATLVSTLLPVVLQVVQVVVSAMAAVLSAVMPAISQIVGIIQASMPLIQTIFSTVFNVIQTVVSTVMPIVSGIISAVMAVIQGDWQGAWSAIQGALSAAWSAIQAGVSAGIDMVLQFFRDLPGNILSVLGNLGSLLLGAGGEIVQGLIDGITGAIGGVADALVGGIQGAVGGVLSFLGIASPSKLFKEIGGYTMKGMAIGIDASAMMAERSMLEAARSVSDAGRVEPSVAFRAGQRRPAADSARRAHGVEQTFNVYANDPNLVAAVVAQRQYVAMRGALA